MRSSITMNDSAQFLPWAIATVFAASCFAYNVYLYKKNKCPRVNTKVQLDSDKVVHSVDIEDIGKKSVYCRCWKSSKFPLCDGSHNQHNESTGDNVGPLIVKQKDA